MIKINNSFNDFTHEYRKKSHSRHYYNQPSPLFVEDLDKFMKKNNFS